MSEIKDISFKPFMKKELIKAAKDTTQVSIEDAKYFANEILKCKNNMIYFAENFFTITSYKGKHTIKLFEKQKEMLKSFVEKSFTVILSSRQLGKCVFKNTKIIIRNKSTKEIETISIEDFFTRFKEQNK